MKKPLIGRSTAADASSDSCCDDSLGQPAPEAELRILRPAAGRRLPLGDLVDALVLDRFGWPVGHVAGYEFDTGHSRVMAVISLNAAGGPSIVIPADRLKLRQAGEYILEATEIGHGRDGERVPAALG